MKLSEAISLGHTLIKESQSCFLSEGCGCAIGSAMATNGYRDQEELYLDPEFEPNLEKNAPVKWLEDEWPWTKEFYTAFGLEKLQGCDSPKRTVAEWISTAHVCGMPRMRIAEILSKIEPEEVIEVVETPEEEKVVVNG